MKKTALVLGAAMLLTSVGLAEAGNTRLKKDGLTMSLWCNSGGCFTKVSGEKMKKIGPGGRSNFKRNVAKYKKKGWK